MRIRDFKTDEGWFRLRRKSRNKFLWLGLWLMCTAPFLTAQTRHGNLGKPLPDAPVPQRAGQETAGQEAARAGISPLGPRWGPQLCANGACNGAAARAGVCCGQARSRFKEYLRAQAYRVYTTRQLAVMAAKDVARPFNLLSEVGIAAIIVGSNSHSIYGPGMPGLARATGVTVTEDMTDKFFGTFLIPSLDHQTPGFRRMPNRPTTNRVAHAVTEVFWTRSQRGRPMFNYATMVGNIAEEGVAATYVPFRNTGWGPAAQRVALNYATDPIGNLIAEFLPQVANHINVRVVFFQNIINRVAIAVGRRPSR